MTVSFKWYPPNGDSPITFGQDDPWKLIRADLGSNEGEPQTHKGPGQIGATLRDHLVDPRVIEMQIALIATSDENRWVRRRELYKAMSVRPARHGEDPEKGLLQILRPGQDTLEVEALPRHSPQFTYRGPLLELVDLEFVAAPMVWKTISDSFTELQQEGGFEWPLEFPLEMVALHVQTEITNAGDMDAPVLLRLYGEITTGRMLNITTDEVIEITGAVAAGDFIEIDTAFGKKSVILETAAGVRSSVMDRLNLAKADFWQLRPGVNTVRFEADSNVSGKATIYYRPRYSGV